MISRRAAPLVGEFVIEALFAALVTVPLWMILFS